MYEPLNFRLLLILYKERTHFFWALKTFSRLVEFPPQTVIPYVIWEFTRALKTGARRLLGRQLLRLRKVPHVFESLQISELV